MSERAWNTFEDSFSKYPKFNNKSAEEIAKKWYFNEIGINEIIQEIDCICFRIGNTEEELAKSRLELGILDPNYQKYKNSDRFLHEKIKFCVEDTLNIKIINQQREVRALNGVLCEDRQGLRYLIATGFLENKNFISREIIKNDEFAEKIKRMKDRYNITELFLGKAEHNEEINKRVLGTQLSASGERDKKAYYNELRKQRAGD